MQQTHGLKQIESAQKTVLRSLSLVKDERTRAIIQGTLAKLDHAIVESRNLRTERTRKSLSDGVLIALAQRTEALQDRCDATTGCVDCSKCETGEKIMRICRLAGW